MTRKITLCADDYAITPAVSQAIRTLLAQKRVNATSVMVNSPEIAAEAQALLALAGAFQIGLHVTLTKCFAKEPTIKWLTFKSYCFGLNKSAIKREIASQYKAFVTHFGRAPDFVDGHQHCHVLPQIRGLLREVLTENNFRGWVRNTRGVKGLATGKGWKAWSISFLAVFFKFKMRNFKLNKSFSGAYDYHKNKDYAAIFPSFLSADLIMCHPGTICETLKTRDGMLQEREAELAYFQSEAFLDALKAANVEL